MPLMTKTHEMARQSETVLTDEYGRKSRVAIQCPRRWTSQTGVLIGLHGAGSDGESLLPYLAPLADRADFLIVCPTAAMPVEDESNLDLAGLMGRRFVHPRWQANAEDFPLRALNWAIETMAVNPHRSVILGYSMGAVAAWSFGLRFASRFAGLIPISGALSMWERFGQDRRTEAMLPNLLNLPIFAIHGDADTKFPPSLMWSAVDRLRALSHDQVEAHVVKGAGHALRTLDLHFGAMHYDALCAWLAELHTRTDRVC